MPTPLKDDILSDSPQGYWPDCITDVSGSGRHLSGSSGVGAAITNDTGDVSATFDGITNFRRFQNFLTTDDATITFECFIIPQAALQTGGLLHICPKGTAADGRGLLLFMASSGGANLRKGKEDGSGFDFHAGMGAFLLEAGKKYHIVSVCGGGIGKIYVNNDLKMNDASDPVHIWFANGVNYYPDPGQFYLCGDRTSDSSPNNTDPNQWFAKVHMAHAAVYIGELSAARIASHYENSGIGLPDAPASVTVTPVSQTQNVPFMLSWAAVVGADSYQVKYSRNGAAQVTIDNAYIGGTSLNFTANQTGSYVFYVATNDGGETSVQTTSEVITVARRGRPTIDKLTILTAGTGNLTGEVVPGGVVKGVVIGIVQTDDDVDEVSSVTINTTIQLTRILRVSQATSEQGAAYLYFLGEGIPTGTLTINVNVSGSTTNKVAFVYTVLAGSNTTLIVHDSIVNASLANPSDTLPLNNKSSFAGLVALSGHNAITDVTPLTDWISGAEVDLGNTVAMAYRYNKVEQADVTYGWTQAADDVIAIGFAVTTVASENALDSMGGLVDLTNLSELTVIT